MPLVWSLLLHSAWVSFPSECLCVWGMDSGPIYLPANHYFPFFPAFHVPFQIQAFSIDLCFCLSFHHLLWLLQKYYRAWDSARIPGPDGELFHHETGHIIPILLFSALSSLSVHRAEPWPISTRVSPEVPWHRDLRT